MNSRMNVENTVHASGARCKIHCARIAQQRHTPRPSQCALRICGTSPAPWPSFRRAGPPAPSSALDSASSHAAQRLWRRAGGMIAQPLPMGISASRLTRCSRQEAIVDGMRGWARAKRVKRGAHPCARAFSCAHSRACSSQRRAAAHGWLGASNGVRGTG